MCQGLFQIFYEWYFLLESFESKCSFLLQKYKHQLLSVSFQPTHPKNNFAYVACQCFTKGWPNLVKFHIIWQVKTDPLIGYVKFLTTQGFIAASMNSYRHSTIIWTRLGRVVHPSQWPNLGWSKHNCTNASLVKNVWLGNWFGRKSSNLYHIFVQFFSNSDKTKQNIEPQLVL